MNILAIDYGEKFVGLAIKRENLDVVFPYQVLDNKNEDDFLNSLRGIIKKEKIDRIVVGRPLGMNSKATEQTKIIDQFIQKLKKAIELPIESFDERLTSKMALNLSKGEGNIHASSAVIILQGYLDSLK